MHIAKLCLSAIRLALGASIVFGSTFGAAQQPVLAPGVTPVASVFTTAGRPRIGLVLGGGGAKGFAHIGVLKELERRHIPVDVITGTSMGAVVGSIYATGENAENVAAIAHGIDWQRVFSDRLNRRDLSFRRKIEDRNILLDFRFGIENGRPVLPKGVLGGQRLFSTVQALLAPWAATTDFDTLAIPFRAVATDIATGEVVVMGDGDFATAVFASMSIPAAFAPVARDGKLLVDGGIANNLPIDIARAMGVDVVIVVNVGDKPRPAESINNAVDVLNQMQLLFGWDVIRRQLASLHGNDVLIEPDITALSVTSFDRLDIGIAAGQAGAIAKSKQLDALSVSDVQWATYLTERAARSHPAPIRIDRIEIANSGKIPDRDVELLVTTRPGDILDGQALQDQIGNIFALDRFDRVQYRIDGSPGDQRLLIEANGTPGGNKYAQFGFVVSSDFGGTSDFALALGLTDRDFLGTGAEWRGYARVGSVLQFDVSLYKKLGRFFVEPTAEYQRFTSILIQNGRARDRNILEVAAAGAGIDGGMVFGNWGEFRAGVRLGGVNPKESTTVSTGVPPGWNTDFNWRVGFTVDTLDSPTFPTDGVFGFARYTNHNTTLGGKFSRDEIDVRFGKVVSFGRTTFLATGRLGLTSNAVTDFIGTNRLGGFLNLSGLPRDALVGQQLLLVRLVGYHRMSEIAPIFDLPIYLGGSIETGNVWDQQSQIAFGNLRTAASVFVGSDTPLGPVFLSYGRSGSSGAIYLVLGRVF